MFLVLSFCILHFFPNFSSLNPKDFYKNFIYIGKNAFGILHYNRIILDKLIKYIIKICLFYESDQPKFRVRFFKTHMKEPRDKFHFYFICIIIKRKNNNINITFILILFTANGIIVKNIALRRNINFLKC